MEWRGAKAAARQRDSVRRVVAKAVCLGVAVAALSCDAASGGGAARSTSVGGTPAREVPEAASDGGPRDAPLDAGHDAPRGRPAAELVASGDGHGWNLQVDPEHVIVQLYPAQTRGGPLAPTLLFTTLGAGPVDLGSSLGSVFGVQANDVFGIACVGLGDVCWVTGLDLEVGIEARLVYDVRSGAALGDGVVAAIVLSGSVCVDGGCRRLLELRVADLSEGLTSSNFSERSSVLHSWLEDADVTPFVRLQPLAVGDGRVYWADDGIVRRVLVAGGAVETVADVPRLTALVLEGERACVLHDPVSESVVLNGNFAFSRSFACFEPDGRLRAVHDTDEGIAQARLIGDQAYFVMPTSGPDGVGAVGWLMRVALDGGASVRIDTPESVVAIDEAGGVLYWIEVDSSEQRYWVYRMNTADSLGD